MQATLSVLEEILICFYLTHAKYHLFAGATVFRRNRLPLDYACLHKYTTIRTGICCWHLANRQVSLPPKDSTLAPGIFNEGTPGPRHFSFLSADDVPGFDPSECEDVYAMSGGLSFLAFARTGMRG